jgi:transcriptional regulator with XRE-family HTH domain
MMRSARSLVNTSEIGRAVRRKRNELGLSLRGVAEKTGISASTLSRIENGTGKPDADNIARLSEWLKVPLERMMGGSPVGEQGVRPVIYFPQEATPDIVEAHLRADRNLSPETAKALAELFRVAYAQFSRPTATGLRRNKRS